jgi:hypothetical protein
VFTLKLSQATPMTTVQFDTHDETAVDGVDYRPCTRP